MIPKNEKEALEYFQKLITKITPTTNRSSENLLRYGIVRAIDSTTNTASVEVYGSGQSLLKASYPSSFNILVGMKYLIATPDVNKKSENYIISDSPQSTNTDGYWRSYNPSYSNFNVGSGTAIGRYSKIGKTINFRDTVVLGSDFTLTGQIIKNVWPVPLASTMTSPVTVAIGNIKIQDLSTGFTWDGFISSSGTFLIFGASSLYVQNYAAGVSLPIPWGVSDNFTIYGSYESL